MNLITQDLSEFLSCKYGLAIRIPVSRCITKLLTKTTLKTTDPDLYSETELLAEYIVYESKPSKQDSRLASVMKKYIAQALLNINYDLKIDLGFDNDVANFYESIDGSVLRTSLYNALRKLDTGKEKVTNKSYDDRSPINFVTTQKRINDIIIEGTPNGIGAYEHSSENLLNQREITVPNGAVGTFLDSVFHAWVDPFEGRTFNSGEATRIYFTIRRSDDSNLDAANVGDFMLVEGTTIPTVYDADSNLYKKPILQGSSVYDTSEAIEGTSQVIYTNEDEYGRTVMYGQGSGATAMRCKTFSIKLKPNTDYSVKIFNSSYSNLQIGGTFMTEPGTVEQYFPNESYMGGGIVNLPSCEPFVASNEQWTRLDTSHSINANNTEYPIDVRPYKFEFCESVADLEAGTYKLMIDILGNHSMPARPLSGVGFGPYLGCYLDVEWNSSGQPVSPSNKFEHFALIGEDDSLIIPETQVFNSSTVRWKEEGDTPYPNFFHQEYTFAVPRKMKVGVLHRAYSRWNYYGGDGDTTPWFRFMIFKPGIEPTEFETTGLAYNISGQSAWEPYDKDVVLHLNIKNLLTGDMNTEIITLSSYLYSEDTAYVNHIECSPGLNKIWVTETDNETGEPATIRFSSNR